MAKQRKARAEKPLTPPSRGRKVARGIKTVGKGLLTVVFAGVLVAANTQIAQYSRMIDTQTGYRKSWDSSAANQAGYDLQYYKPAYDKDSIAPVEEALDRQISSEGYVLLKNDGQSLPLPAGTTLSFFGESSAYLMANKDLMANFTGMRGNFDGVAQAFENRGFAVNHTLGDFYSTGEGSKYQIGQGSILFGESEDFSINECPLSVMRDAGVLDSAQGTTPVFVMKRVAGEGRDMPRSMVAYASSPEDQAKNYLKPDSTELEILQYLNDNYDNTVLVLNTASAMELDWLDQFPNIRSVVLVPSTGTYGLESLADILSGAVNPSGRTVDTFAADALGSPAAQNYGDYQYLDEDGNLTSYNYLSELEGIYVGYRYYETRFEDAALGQGNAGDFDYDEEVVYPFGYGLSYTTFDWTDFSCAWDGTECTASVTVTNTGDVAGKDVVELYAQSPYTDYDRANGIEKPAVQLVGFAKTKQLEPGESQTVTVTFDQDALKAYDANGAKTYILDAGTYYVTAAHDAHDATLNVLAAKGGSAEGDATRVATYVPANTEVDTSTYATDSATGTAITNQFDDARPEGTMLSRSDWQGTWPQHDGEPVTGTLSTWGGEINATDENGNAANYVWGKTASADLLAQLQSTDSGNPTDDATLTDAPVYGAQNGVELIDLRGKSFDDPLWDDLLDQITYDEYVNEINISGYGTPAMPSINKPFTLDADGPNNWNTGGTGHKYPDESVLAQTFNQELTEQFGAIMGEEALIGGANSWYAPSFNIHRTPFSGRNAGYFSEDPTLNGIMGSIEVREVAKRGVYATIKHFALNDQESHRGDRPSSEQGVATWAGEQAIREVYLKPFEMCLKLQPVEESYLEADGNGGYNQKTVEVPATTGVMSAFNRVGATWAGGDYDLLTDVLRGEWGFRGEVITDSAAAGKAYMDCEQMCRAGGNIKLVTFEVPGFWRFDKDDAASYHYARQAMHSFLYAVANSNAMNGAMHGSVYSEGPQNSTIMRVAMSAVAVAGLAAIGITGWHNHKRNQRERELFGAGKRAAR